MFTIQGKSKGRQRRLAILPPVLFAAVAFSVTTAVGQQPIIYFSTEESFVATSGPHAGQVISHGDLLSSAGQVVATNAYLIRNFGPMPPPPDFGLDGVHLRASKETLFSIEERFWDESLATWVSHGDLLSDNGSIVQTNHQLLRNFGPMPTPDDYGLDAIYEPSNREVEFSIEQTFWDESLSIYVGHGDLLSDTGVIVKTNPQLLQNFNPMPSPETPDYGLDALHRPTPDDIWFSIEQTFWDELLGTWVSHGDLLSDSGTIVKTNAELLAGFFGGADNVTRDYGLDAVWVVPEPATMTLLAIGGLVTLIRRRR